MRRPPIASLDPQPLPLCPICGERLSARPQATLLLSPLARRVRALLRALARPARGLRAALSWRLAVGRRPALRRKVLAGALAGGLAALTALPLPARSASPPVLGLPRAVPAVERAAQPDEDAFGGGEVLDAATIAGDGVQALGRSSAQPRRSAGRVSVEGEPLVALPIAGDGARALAPQGYGDLMLTGGGVDWLLNTNVVEQTSSASGAFYDAAFAELVPATTADGGVVTTTLDDAFDGYKALCIGGDCGCTGPDCGGDALVYGGNGPPTPDNTCLGNDLSAPDQYSFGAELTPQLRVVRKVYVPDSATFARHLEVVTNLTDQPQSADLTLFGNLGSEDGSRVSYDTTVIIATSSGDDAASDADYWVTTMQEFGPDGTSPDPRIAHVLGGPGGQVKAVDVRFAAGDERPSWRYHLELAPRQTAIIMSFVSLHVSRPAANAGAERLLDVDRLMLACMSPAEQGLVANWRLPAYVFVPLIRG